MPEKETGRIEAFSDGVFAIAITLLVLNLHVPEPRELTAGETLATALVRQWPIYLAYITSFMTILVMWINHHRLFQHIHRLDDKLLVWNGMLLMTVTLVPFPTSLLAEYILKPDAKVAAAIYSGLSVFLALFYNLLWHHAADEERLLHPEHDRKAARTITDRYRFGPLVYLITFALSFINVAASIGLCLALAIFFAIPSDGKPKQKNGPKAS